MKTRTELLEELVHNLTFAVDTLSELEVMALRDIRLDKKYRRNIPELTQIRTYQDRTKGFLELAYLLLSRPEIVGEEGKEVSN